MVIPGVNDYADAYNRGWLPSPNGLGNIKKDILEIETALKLLSACKELNQPIWSLIFLDPGVS
ncbi:hypothetical protein [Leptolyngbya ohadii]|uniref:hypothetical protein n=1 Tax=Leptolyngbya ohadii TaxID=1962290 RepID=UPI000B5A07B7|nr:hypothetical protein [Leptolyngbya ohadii]